MNLCHSFVILARVIPFREKKELAAMNLFYYKLVENPKNCILQYHRNIYRLNFAVRKYVEERRLMWNAIRINLNVILTKG